MIQTLLDTIRTKAAPGRCMRYQAIWAMAFEDRKPELDVVIQEAINAGLVKRDGTKICLTDLGLCQSTPLS